MKQQKTSSLWMEDIRSGETRLTAEFKHAAIKKYFI